jgi:DGQHR domain-containing protein
MDSRIGIQRTLNGSRVNEIKKYVELSDACFPNSVILSVDGEDIDDVKQISEDYYEISLYAKEDTFKIIDGQHRIAGLESVSKHFEVNISLFLDMDIELQAILFSTINSNQKQVPPSLMADLLAIQKNRNPMKSAHYIGSVLNEGQSEKDALVGKITPFAIGRVAGATCITLANFVKRISKYISGNKMQMEQDRDDLKNGVSLVYANEKAREKLIFRNLFIDERDADIAKIVRNYFNAIYRKWPKAWKEEEYILSRTVGFNALLVLMKEVVAVIGKYDMVISEEEFYEVFERMPIKDEEWLIKADDNYTLNGSGQSYILKILRKNLGE